jgi:hypothetical protein
MFSVQVMAVLAVLILGDSMFLTRQKWLTSLLISVKKYGLLQCEDDF